IRLLLPSYVGRNRKRNNGARRYAPFGPDAPSVRFHETATDGESETASACLPASPVKTLKHELHLLLGYPWSAVEHGNLEIRTGIPNANFDGLIGGRILQRVIEEIHEHLADEGEIERHQELVWREIELDPPPASRFAKLFDRGLDHIESVAGLPLHARRRLPAATCREDCRPGGSVA